MAATATDAAGHSLRGTGGTALWGLAPALDLVECVGSDCAISDVLLVGTSDVRHIARTAARIHRRQASTRINFHVIECQSSILARHLLLLSILFDPLDDIGLHERANLFLECYGNLLVREKTAQWISEQASELIRVITDGKGVLAKIIDFSNLKFRERDDIEFSLKYWRDDSRRFDAKALWDIRLRQYYGIRYDARDNAIDWDYHMKVRDADKKASIIHKSEFLRWRLHGIAFEVRESTYSSPNRSMATVDLIKQNGVSVPKWGYFSDILFGTYAAFGIDTEAKQMLKTSNGNHKHLSQEISEYNVRELIHELKTGTPYEENVPPKIAQTESEPYNVLDRIRIIFHPCDASHTLDKKRAKYESKFDCIVISSAMAHRLTTSVPLLRPGGRIIIEGVKFMIELNNDHVKAYDEKVHAMAKEAGLVHVASDADQGRSAEFLVFEKP